MAQEFEIAVTANQEAVAEALKHGARRREPLTRFLDNPTKYPPWEPVVRHALLQNRDEVLSSMTAMAKDTKAPVAARSHAIQVLLEAGDVSGIDPLHDLLIDGDGFVRRQAVDFALNGSYLGAEYALAEPKILSALRGLLEDPDPELRLECLRIAARTDVGQALTLDALEFVRSRLSGPVKEQSLALEALRELLRAKNSTVKEQTRAVLRQFVIETKEQLTERRRRAIQILAENPDAADHELLNSLREDQDVWWALARLDGIQFVPFLLAKIKEDRIHSWRAIEALGIAAAGSNDSTVTEAVLAAEPKWFIFPPASWLAALAKIGKMAGKAGFRHLLQRGDRWLNSVAAMEALWILLEINPASVLVRLQQLGILDGRVKVYGSELFELNEASYNTIVCAMTYQGIVLFYDSSDYQEDLLFEVADHSMGLFQPDGVQQRFDNEEKAELSFVHDGRLYTARFPPRQHSEAVIWAANRALRDSGRSRQFLHIAVTDDQMAWYVFIDLAAACAAADELLLMLDSSLVCDEPDESQRPVRARYLERLHRVLSD
jgi:HEAT repeat protein